jgi:hypothetical protein
MSAIFEGRPSASPYIRMIWRGRVLEDYYPVCPADVRWNLLFTKREGKVQVSVEGATSQHVPKQNFEGAEFLVIKFSLGVYLPYLPAGKLRDTDAKLPDASSKTFWLNGDSWQLPDFDNVETFVDRLVREEVLVTDPVIWSVMQNKPVEVSSRTVRRRFLYTTGLTPKSIEQIERAHMAATLLEQGASILDTAFEAGYADQPHMTRSLKRFYGQTPAQIARESMSG